MRKKNVQAIALTGMLFALAVVLSFFESLLVPLMGLPPGVKLGLANVVVMYALLFLSARYALALVVLKAGFGFLTRGAMAGILSGVGGGVSFIIMWLLLMLLKSSSVLLLSVSGALGHNIGQFIAIRVIGGHTLWYYLPVLLVSGVLMGVLTSVTLKVLLPALQKTGVHPKGYAKAAISFLKDRDKNEFSEGENMKFHLHNRRALVYPQEYTQLSLLQEILQEYDIELIEVASEATELSIASLAGEAHTPPPVLSAEIPAEEESCIVFAGLRQETLERVLETMREKQVTATYKAVMIPENQNWAFSKLLQEMRKEKEKTEKNEA